MTPYHEIFRHEPLPALTLDVARKSGGIPKGSYRFLECYCTEPGCDCRRVVVTVVNEKGRRQALIHLALDAGVPCAGPYLEPAGYQAAHATALLEFFASQLNSRPDCLMRIHEQYREVRELVDQKRYRGRSFPAPGKILLRPMPAPDLHSFLEESLTHSRGHMAAVRALTVRCGPSSRKPGGKGTPGSHGAPGAAPGMAGLVELYAEAGPSGPVGILLALQDELRRHLLAHPAAGEELASMLPVLCRQSPQNDEKIDAALRMLHDVLDFYRVEAEGGSAAARQQMQRFQKALALRIFVENDDVDLRLAVTGILSGARVKLIPDLLEASSRSVTGDGARTDLHEPTKEEFLCGIADSLRSMGVISVFAGAQEILQLCAGDPELQIPLAGALMTAEDPFLREISALLIFNCDPDAPLQVSQFLASVAGSSITPETLRRLIISRNWFPEAIRKNIDRAINAARTARVACAPLARPPSLTVYASPVDGSGAQGLHAVVPDGTGYAVCSLALKLQTGIEDCFVRHLKTRRELDALVGKLLRRHCCRESSPEYLDQRVCRALADGARRGIAPGHWVLCCAEMLGRDGWRG